MPTGYTTISKRRSEHISYTLRLRTQPFACRYCSRVFDPSSPKASSVFLTLLRIYLQPGVSSTAKSSTRSTLSLPPPAILLQPALQLISRHSRRLDATETLKLLPPLVQARDVKEFLVESLRVPRFDTRVIGEIARARRDDVATRLMVLEERRVKVVDSRMWVTDFPLPHLFPLHSTRIFSSSTPSHFLSLLHTLPQEIVCSPPAYIHRQPTFIHGFVGVEWGGRFIGRGLHDPGLVKDPDVPSALGCYAWIWRSTQYL